MKKILIVVLLLCAGSLTRAGVTIDFTVGVLANNSGTPMADGTLVQLIASSDNVFFTPTDSAFIGGNDVILFSGGMDSVTSGGTSGAMLFSLTNITLAQGTNLLVRWFPSLAAAASSPGFSTSYGQYGSLTDIAWVSPADGSTVAINFQTVSAFGSIPDSVGFANLATAPVPEPSTYAAILGALALGIVAYRRRVTST